MYKIKIYGKKQPLVVELLQQDLENLIADILEPYELCWEYITWKKH